MKLEDCYRLIRFPDLGDERGNLIVAEGNDRDIPFSIKRVFYMYGSDDTIVRGKHANKRTEFVLINVKGKSKVKVDNGVESTVVELDQPCMGLYLKQMVWKEMYDFSEDSILLVLASEHYDGAEYIRNYDDFLDSIRTCESEEKAEEA